MVPSLLYIDRNIIHEGSFHAFANLRSRGMAPRRPEQMFGVPDHYVPTHGRRAEDAPTEEIARMIRVFDENMRWGQCPALLARGSSAGHRPHHWAGARHHAAGSHHHLQRQPHSPRARSAQSRSDRPVRERACDGDADALAGEAEDFRITVTAGARRRRGKDVILTSSALSGRAAHGYAVNMPAGIGADASRAAHGMHMSIEAGPGRA
jgi:hypothetical protein